MTIKTSKHLVPSLRGAAFRRVTCDGRTWYARSIKTMRMLDCQAHPADAPQSSPQLNGHALGHRCLVESRQVEALPRNIR